MELDDKTKAELQIVSVTDHDFVIRNRNKELYLWKNEDFFEITVENNDNMNSISLNKKQIDAIISWFNS